MLDDAQCISEEDARSEGCDLKTTGSAHAHDTCSPVVLIHPPLVCTSPMHLPNSDMYICIYSISHLQHTHPSHLFSPVLPSTHHNCAQTSRTHAIQPHPNPTLTPVHMHQRPIQPRPMDLSPNAEPQCRSSPNDEPQC